MASSSGPDVLGYEFPEWPLNPPAAEPDCVVALPNRPRRTSEDAKEEKGAHMRIRRLTQAIRDRAIAGP